jgi:hypothetical protein
LKKTVYHYSDRCLRDGELVTAFRDSFDTLTDTEKVFETAIRDIIPDGHNIRSSSLFTWETDGLVRRVWEHIPKKYFYELEIDTDDIVFKADLNYYNEGKDAAKAGAPLDQIAATYASGAIKPNAMPRIEILVKKAIVKRKLLSK